MGVSFTVITPPASEPLALVDVKKYLRVDFDDEDDIISGLITKARVYGERLCKRAFPTQTIEAIIELVPAPAGQLSGPVDAPIDPERLWERPGVPLFGYAMQVFKLPMSPVQQLLSIDYQLTRMDVPEWKSLPAQDAQGNDNYRIDTVADPAVVSLFTILAATRYRFTYTAGSSSVPEDIQDAMLNWIAFRYNNREGQEIPGSIEALFLQERIWEL